MNRIKLDGKEYGAKGLDALTLTYGLDEGTKSVGYVTADSITITGDGYKYLKSKFFSGQCSDQATEVKVDLYLSCCSRWYDFTITYKGLQYCPEDCEITVGLQRINAQTDALHYLKNTIYWKNGFIDAFEHPKIYYCNQPGFIQIVLLLMFFVLLPIIIAIQVIVDVVKGVCEVVTLSFGECDLGDAEDINVCTIYEYIGGCGRYQPSPLIRNILEFHASSAGLTFQSSIFQQSVHKNAVLFQAQYESGIRAADVSWIEENGANLTPIQLLDRLKDPYALDYQIIGNALVVERQDYFKTLLTNIGTVTGCFEFDPVQPCAYGDYKYVDDALDNQGNRLRSNYDDIVEFNAEGAEWKSGSCDITAQFGRARFMYDQRGKDKPDDVPGGDSETILGDNFIDDFRSTNAFNAFGCGDDRRFNDLILHNHQASQLKILVLEDGFDREDAKTIKRDIGGGFYAYNYPMYFREDEPQGLYQTFRIIDNPNQSGRITYAIDQAELPWSCELLDKLESAATGYSVTTELGEAEVETVDVNVEEKTITAKNIKITCDA